MKRFPKSEKIEELVTAVEQASNEDEVKAACDQFQDAVYNHYGLDDAENISKGSWKLPLTEARKAVEAVNPDYRQYLSTRWVRSPSEENKGQATTPAPVSTELKSLQYYLEDESEENQDMVENALQFSGMSEDEFIRKAIVSYARNFKPHAQADVSNMETSELIGSKLKGSSEELTQRAIDAIIDYNLSQPEIDNRYQITVTGVKALTGCRHEIIKRVMDEQKTKIHDHHEHHVSHSRVWNRGKPDIRSKVTGFKSA